MSWALLRHGLAALLASGAVLLTLACALGLAVMRSPWQKLHFVAPPSTVGAALLTAAVALEGGLLAAVKPLLVTLLLTVLNGVVTHALARAAFVREHRRWPPRREEEGA